MDTDNMMTGGTENTAGAAQEVPGGEDDALLPEGWGAGDDFFAGPETWTGAAGGQGPGEEDGANEEGTTGETAPTTEQAAAPTTGKPETGDTQTEAGEDTAPATGPETQAEGHKKLKFRARIDREDREVELDENELPDVYQRAQNHQRMQSRVNALAPLVESAQAMAKRMGYESLEDMIGKAEGSYADSEVRRLTADGVHEEVARDMVRRRMDAAAPAREKPQSGARDFRAETQQLLEARPELKGQKLPEEVVRECVQSGKHLMTAYAEYETKQERAETARLKERLRILEQNQAAAAKAPVKGATGGGQTDTRSEDPFLKGFDSDD